MLLIAAVFAVFPPERNWTLVAAAAGAGVVLTIVGSGRVYRPAVTKTGDSITCRFDPWREGSFYLLLFGMPLFILIPIAGASSLGSVSPNFWRLLGVFLLALTLRFLFVFVGQRRSSLLRISPGALAVSVPGHGDGMAEIHREAVESVTATTGKLRNNDTAPVTQINYHPKDSAGGGTRTVLFGPTNSKKIAWLTVEQSDLLAGLQAWKDGDPNDPGLMDRVEQLLCGSRPATSDSATH